MIKKINENLDLVNKFKSESKEEVEAFRVKYLGKKGILNYPNLWIFLDEDRVSDEILFLKSIPATRQLGIIVRTKNKKYLYNKAKKVRKICRLKGFKFFISSSPEIAMSLGADGVHFSQESRKTRIYKISIIF